MLCIHKVHKDEVYWS